MHRRSRWSAFTLVAIIALALVALLGLPAVAGASATYTQEELAFYSLINQYRQANGAGPLLLSDMVSDACTKHNLDMGKYKFFDHYSQASDYYAVGASPWDRMAASGYNYNTWKGENIAAGYPTAASVFDGWKNSSGHNANMLNANFTVIGISMDYVAGSPYGYYWTTDFGGYVDATAHNPGSGGGSTTTTTARPTTTTTTRPTTTTTARPTTTTRYTPPTTTTRYTYPTYRSTTTTTRYTTPTYRSTTTTNRYTTTTSRYTTTTRYTYPTYRSTTTTTRFWWPF